MSGCATVSPVSEFYQPVEESDAPHKIAMALATNALQDITSAADELQRSIVRGDPPEDQARLHAAGMAHAESYLNLMARAATQTLAQEP